MHQSDTAHGDSVPAASAGKLSYKFQRLREKLRAAIDRGELSGKLPGERQLARRFRVNAKTLSKALTDLAAEGLLDRSIGRGTFVRGAADPQSNPDRWLIICDPEQASADILRALQHANPNTQIVTQTSDLRPSFLNQFKSVINFGWSTPREFLRSLVVRNMNVVVVNRDPEGFSMNAVLVDRAQGAWYLARDLMLAGHRHFLAIEKRGQTTLADAIRRAAARYCPEAVVESGDPADVPAGVGRGATAIVCGLLPLAEETRRVLEHHGIEFPARVSLAAVAAGIGQYPCSGYFVHADQKADAIIQLLRDGQAKRPTTLWLHGEYVDLGTTGPVPRLMMDPVTAELARYNPLSV